MQGRYRHQMPRWNGLATEKLVGDWSEAHLERTALGLDTSISDFTVINNHGITTSAARSSIGPANALGELCVRVGQE